MREMIWLIMGALAIATLAAAEQAPGFHVKPAAVRAGDAVQITFSADHETDAAVYILDAKGKCVRHLAAGVLGKTPPPPMKPGLTQALDWDGKDDAGKPAAGGPFRARVALGLKPEFDSFVLFDTNGCGRVLSLAVGPGGSVYVFHQDNTANPEQGGYKLKIYNRDSRHQKTLIPFPAGIAPDRVKALGVFRAPEGDLVPRLHNYELLSFYPDNVNMRSSDMPQWSSPAVDSKGRVYWLVKGPSLVAVDPDGGIPYDNFLGPNLLPDVKQLNLAGGLSEYWYERPSLAVSPDDKYVYLAGLTVGKDKTALPCVFRVSTATRGPAEVFVGKQDQSGDEKELLTAPRGLAVAKGLLYVADFGANRVAVFKESDRSFVGEIKVKHPDSVGIDPASGAVYVCSYSGGTQVELVKFSGMGSAAEVCRLTLPKAIRANFYQHRIAVDATAKPVRIWMPTLVYEGFEMTCIEDAGDKLVSKGDPRGKPQGIEGHRDLVMDRVRGELYIKGGDLKYYRLDAETGQVKDVLKLKIGRDTGTQVVPGSDGNLYALSALSLGLRRYDHQGKPINFEGQTNSVIAINGPRCFQDRNMALPPFAPPDDFYITTPPDQLTHNPKDDSLYYAIDVFGQDGKAKRTVVWQCQNKAIPRVDAKGNIYVADLVKPPERSYPEFFDGKLPPPPASGDRGASYWNSHMYGSIIKFPPSGGIIWFQKTLTKSCVGEPSAELLAKPKVPFRNHAGYKPLETGSIQGALWIRFGYSPFASRIVGFTSHCACEGSGFDVDPFGRVFYPNLGQFRVEVVDTDNNWIGSFGKYGNEDDGVRNSGAGIPLAWPCYVAVSDHYAYVADTINRRIVRVKLAYAADGTCALP